MLLKEQGISYDLSRTREKGFIKYSNEISLESIGKLSKIEHDIFASILVGLKEADGKSNIVSINLNDIKEIVKLKKMPIKEMLRFVNNVVGKMLAPMRYNVYYIDENEKRILLESVLVFKKWSIETTVDRSELYLTLQLNIDDVKKLFNKIEKTETYTKIMFKEFIEIKNKYAKSLCHLLSRNFKGEFYTSIENFKKSMGFTNGYSQTTMNKQVKKAVDTLIRDDIFEYIEYEWDRCFTRGCPVRGVKFKFKFTKKYKMRLNGYEQQELDFHKQEEKTEEFRREEASFCPNCQAPLFSRICKGNGEHSGEKQVVCRNNGYYHGRGPINGNGECDFSEYREVNKKKTAAVEETPILPPKREHNPDDTKARREAFKKKNNI